MPGLPSPGYKPSPRPPARPPQPGSYVPTAGGQQYVPSPEENAEAQRQAAARRQAQDDAWSETDRIDAARRLDAQDQFDNQRYADSRSDRREGINRMDQALNSLFDFGGGGGGGGGGGNYAYDPAADAATYTRAKENTGRSMQAALDGLDETMNARGIFSSGIHGSELGELYEDGLGELAEVDRQIAEGTADRRFQSSEAAAGRNWQSGENAKDRAARMAQSRLESIMQMFGMVY